MIVSRLFQKTILHNTYTKLIWVFSLAFVALIPYLYTILFSPVSLDGSYYLSMVERIRDGLVPYRDFTLEYTPILFYITAGIKNLFSIGLNYAFDLGFHFCLQLVVAFLLYKIALLLLQRRDYSYYAALFYLLISFWITQYEFILEIPSLLWGLWAIYLTIKFKDKTTLFLLIGIIASLSFLTKQYGFGFFFLITYLILFNPARWKQLLLFVVGYSIPVIVLTVCIPEIAKVFLGNGYGTQLIEKSVGVFFLGVLKRMGLASGYFLYRVPVLLLAIGLFPVIPPKQRIYAGLFLLGIAGFMLQFVFAIFNHYGLYIIPFVSIYIFLVLDNLRNNKIIKGIYVLFLILVFVFAVQKNFSRIAYMDRQQRTRQYALANKIKQCIPSGKTLYIADVRLVDLYYPMNVKPTNRRYTFGLTLTEKLHYRQLHDADYILTYAIPDKQNFEYLNSVRVKDYFSGLQDQTVIERDVYFDKELKTNREQRILLFKNRY